MRIMVDTNIIISATRNPNGTPFAILGKKISFNGYLISIKIFGNLGMIKTILL